MDQIIDNRRLQFVHGPIYFRLANMAFENSDYSTARSYFNKVIGLTPDSDISERSQSLLEQISAREKVDSQTIGVILPLSGKHEAIGKSVLNSIQLGFDLFGDSSSPYRLAIMDSEGKPSTAQRAVEKLVTEDHVVAIVGSILSKTASAVASKSQNLGVPTIVLSQKSDITNTGDYIFRNALTGKMQVHHLVKNAMEKHEVKRFAILYPNDAYGIEYTNLFWDEVIAQGGEVSGAQPYDPKETDFRKPIQRLVGTYYMEDREEEYTLRLEEWKEKQPVRSSRKKIPRDLLPPLIDFDAIFIPDSTKALGQIAPMLVFNDIREVALLGTNLWNTPTVARRAGKFMKSSIFVDSFLSKDPAYRKSAFVKKYRRNFGKNPSIFDLQAFDSATVLQSVLKEGGNRVDVRNRLATLNGLPGALSSLDILENREISRPVVTLTLIGGQIAKYTGPPPKEEDSKKNK